MDAPHDLIAARAGKKCDIRHFFYRVGYSAWRAAREAGADGARAERKPVSRNIDRMTLAGSHLNDVLRSSGEVNVRPIILRAARTRSAFILSALDQPSPRPSRSGHPRKNRV